MEMTEKPIRQLYFKYLIAAFGSALVGAIYTLVDMAIIGQYAGPTGTAAITLVLPVWSFICSLGILTGIGGSVLYILLRCSVLTACGLQCPSRKSRLQSSLRC